LFDDLRHGYELYQQTRQAQKTGALKSRGYSWDSAISPTLQLSPEDCPDGYCPIEPTDPTWRPFDRDRDGFVLAEGAAVVVLEELEQAKARGANILAEVLGYATSGDAYHIAAPDESGIGARNAMTWAMRDAGVSPDQIGYINAHGTSTPLGDAAEVRAVKTIFGDHAKRLAMSSTKSMTGHALGAAGGIETIAVVKALQTGILPPTINLQSPDDEFDLDFVPNEAVSRQVDYAINNSFGFGGHNVSLVFGRWHGE
jgi:3-oxoacyl-[acyl-carrier-protein] synthase II